MWLPFTMRWKQTGNDNTPLSFLTPCQLSTIQMTFPEVTFVDLRLVDEHSHALLKFDAHHLVHHKSQLTPDSVPRGVPHGCVALAQPHHWDLDALEQSFNIQKWSTHDEIYISNSHHASTKQNYKMNMFDKKELLAPTPGCQEPASWRYPPACQERHSWQMKLTCQEPPSLQEWLDRCQHATSCR